MSDAVRELALRETDPDRYQEFIPITRGPLFAVATLFLIGIAAAGMMLMQQGKRFLSLRFLTHRWP